MIGDNLGSHQIGGFTENFSSSEYFCRYCLYDRKSLRNFNMQYADLRTPENFNSALQQLSISGAETHTGIKKSSILNELENYHVCAPGLPPCIAHDLFEGIIPFDLMEIIKYFHNQKIVSVDYINWYLAALRRKFKLSLSFPKIDLKRNKVQGKAFEIWNILILMPHIMMGFIHDFEDSMWKFFISMVEMSRIICASEVSLIQTTLLGFYIDNYFAYRKESCPLLKLRPKHHYVFHYPGLIRKFGPLRSLWTMAFEQKHQYFKQIAKKSKNFKNITYTLVKSHQEFQSTIGENRFNYTITADNVMRFSKNIYNVEIQNEYVFISKRIHIYNTTYKENDNVLIKQNDEAEIEIMNIQAVFIDSLYKKAIIYGKVTNFWYNEHTTLYESINSEICTKCVNLEKLLLKKPVNLLKKNTKYYFSPYNTFIQPF